MILMRSVFLIGVAALSSACEKDEEPSQMVVATEVSTVPVKSRDGRIAADIPIDLLVATFDHAIMATSADGNFRVDIERVVTRASSMADSLGALKDEVIGLGWVIDSEKHYDAAVQLQMTHNARGHLAERGFWLVTRATGDSTQLAVCDGLGREGQLERVRQPLRTICQSISFAAN